MAKHSLMVSSRPTKSLKGMGCFQDKRHWYLLSILPLDFAASLNLCRKDSHESCSRYYYFLREGPVTRRALSTTLGARAEAWGPRSDVRRPNSRGIDEHISNDGRSNRTPTFIGEIH